MVRRKRINKRKINEFLKFERKLGKDVSGVEKWVIERRKFFIKLSIVLILILLLILYSRFFVK